MTPALRALESEILNGRIAHGDHPVLSMCAGNAVVKGTDDDRKLDKIRSAGRIDGMVALAMAMGVAPLNREPAVSVFDIIAQSSADGAQSAVGDELSPDDEAAILRNHQHPRWQEVREQFESRLFSDDRDFF